MFAQIVSNTFHSLSINPIPGTSSTNTIQEWYKLIKVFIPSKSPVDGKVLSMDNSDIHGKNDELIFHLWMSSIGEKYG